MVSVIAEIEVVHVIAVLGHIFFVLYEAALVGPIYPCTSANTVYPAIVSCLSSHNVWWGETLGGFIVVGAEYVMLVNNYDIAVLASRMDEDFKLPTYVLNGEQLLKVSVGPVGIPCSATCNGVEVVVHV